jgi:hypothetical protein
MGAGGKGKHHHGNGNGNGGGGGNSPQGPATFNAGTLPSTTVDSYNQWFSNTDPLSYLRSNQSAGGGRLENGGNADFQQWQDDAFAPGIQSQLEAARANGYTVPGTGQIGTLPGGAGGGPGHSPSGALPHQSGGRVGPNPSLSLDDFIQGRDLVNEARNTYAFRSNAQRLPGPLNLSGRWSWWS